MLNPKPSCVTPTPQNGSTASPVFMKGDRGDDILTGGSDHDFLDGGPGADRIDGGAGNDILWIDGNDTLVQGGPGFDVAIVARSSAITIDLFTAGLEVLYSSSGNDVITMSGGGYGVRVRAGAGDDTVSLSGVRHFRQRFLFFVSGGAATWVATCRRVQGDSGVLWRILRFDCFQLDVRGSQ